MRSRMARDATNCPTAQRLTGRLPTGPARSNGVNRTCPPGSRSAGLRPATNLLRQDGYALTPAPAPRCRRRSGRRPRPRSQGRQRVHRGGVSGAVITSISNGAAARPTARRHMARRGPSPTGPARSTGSTRSALVVAFSGASNAGTFFGQVREPSLRRPDDASRRSGRRTRPSRSRSSTGRPGRRSEAHRHPITNGTPTRPTARRAPEPPGPSRRDLPDLMGQPGPAPDRCPQRSRLRWRHGPTSPRP